MSLHMLLLMLKAQQRDGTYYLWDGECSRTIDDLLHSEDVTILQSSARFVGNGHNVIAARNVRYSVQWESRRLRLAA